MSDPTCLGVKTVTKALSGYLGPCRLLNVVYSGPSSQIWQAHHGERQCLVAVKTLVDSYRTSRRHIGYLRREFKVGSTLACERVIRIHEFAVDQGIPFLTMEWFAGATMKHRIQQGPAVVTQFAAKMVVQAAEALAYFNARGWVHRDIKPENFLVADNGDVKLIDFALAQRPRGWLARFFAPRSRVQGTKSYMSPEQIQGRPLDQRADVYSLGCTLYELLAGKPPYAAASAKELLKKHLNSPPPALETVNRRVTPEFGQLIRWAMAKDPAERPPTAEVFYQRIAATPAFRRTA